MVQAIVQTFTAPQVGHLLRIPRHVTKGPKTLPLVQKTKRTWAKLHCIRIMCLSCIYTGYDPRCVLIIRSQITYQPAPEKTYTQAMWTLFFNALLPGMVGLISKLQIVGTFVGRIFHPKRISTGPNPWPKNDEKCQKKQKFFSCFGRAQTHDFYHGLPRVNHGFAMGSPRVWVNPGFYLNLGFPVRNPGF